MQQNGQVLIDIKHGEDVPEQKAVLEIAQNGVQGRAPDGVLGIAAAEPEEVLFETPFDYLFPTLKANPAAHLPAGDPAKIAAVVAGLKALGDAMVEDALAPGEEALQPTGNSTIPPIYTYWGQFIDHDLTANTDRDSAVSNISDPNLAPLDPDVVVDKLKNLRQPTVNLDSVYGDGPTFDPNYPTQAGSFYDGIKFRIGKVALNPPLPAAQSIPGVPIPPDRLDGTAPKQVFVPVDQNRDLPRIGALIDAGVIKAADFPTEFSQKPNFRQLAFIADARNDENLILAQLHLVFLRFHNAAVDWVRANERGLKTPRQQFERAQQLTRWQHQWLVVNDFLKTMTLSGVVDKVLLGGLKLYKPTDKNNPFMPLEFSVAAYRFGHTMVRAAYDYNRNFGRPGNVIPSASFDLLFAFTGNGSQRNPATGAVTLNPFLGGSKVLPFNWIIEWNRFIDKGSSVPDHFARKIDTRLAPPLRDLINQGNDPAIAAPIKAIQKRLARRNLLRGYLLSLPTGQSVAKEIGIAALSKNELRVGNSGPLNQVLEDNGFLEQTPLWYYVLKEAEVRANGNSLGELGSQIVCETIIGQLRHDPESYLNRTSGWDPGKGVKFANGAPIVTISDFIRFAGLSV